MINFFGCGAKKYNVDYDGCKFMYEGAKDSYRAGERVTLYYGLIATDTDYRFTLDGAELDRGYDEKKGFVLSFIMPEHDVKLSVESRNTMVLEYDPRFKPSETLRFHSFDGGGMQYTVKIDDPSVVSCRSEREYSNPDHELIDGAAYNMAFTFTGLEKGRTTVTVYGRSPIMDDEETIYEVEVDERGYVCVTETEHREG